MNCIGLDMPLEMFPPPAPLTFGVTDLRAIGTNAHPDDGARNFLAHLASLKGFPAAEALAEYHKLHFLGKGMTKQSLIRCLERTWGSGEAFNIAATIEKKMLAAKEFK